MRFADDLRKSVVFFGYRDTTQPSGVMCVGTGFLLGYKNTAYLVTAKHLSHQLGNDPFVVRLNKKVGTAAILHADNVTWYEHSDPTVDVSLTNLHLDSDSRYDAIYLNGDVMLATPDRLKNDHIGIGNQTYTIGLFRLLVGQKRNLPVCHMGSIALLPDDERVPVVDRTDPEPIASRKRRISVEAYLVEAQSMGGLSGSPVFVRSDVCLNLKGIFANKEGGKEPPSVLVSREAVHLLGLWQGAWAASPDEVRAAESNAHVVPVGMGLVVPSEKIVELLERDDVKKERDRIQAQRNPPAAQTQAVAKPESPTASSAEEEADGDHRERFKSLLDVAVKQPKSSD